MIFTPTTITNLQVGFSLLFEKANASEEVPILWPTKAERVDTPGLETNAYGWLAEMPLFRRWYGARIAKRLAARVHTIKNEKWEMSYSVARDDIKFDRFGIYNGHASRAGLASRVFYDQLITEKQMAGHTTKCFDGQFFYDTDHPRVPEEPGSPTFANLFTARPPTSANIAFVYAAMAGLKDANGRSMRSAPNVIEFGPALRDQVLTALNADIIATVIKNVAGDQNVGAAGVSNNTKGLLTPMLNEEMEDGVWFMHHTRLMKPFLLQVESEPTGLESRVNAEDPHVWDNDEFLFGARAYAGAGYTLPHLSARVETT